MILTIIRGLPGSGKSTFAKKLNVFHVEADMFCMKNGEYLFDVEGHGRCHMWCLDTVERAMLAGCDCVVSNTFTLLGEVQPYLDLAKRFGYQVEIVRMDTAFGSIHGVPGNVYEMLEDRFEDIEGEKVIGEPKTGSVTSNTSWVLLNVDLVSNYRSDIKLGDMERSQDEECYLQNVRGQMTEKQAQRLYDELKHRNGDCFKDECPICLEGITDGD